MNKQRNVRWGPRGPRFTERGASTQSACEPEVIEVAPGKKVAVITPKVVYKIIRDTQEVYDVSKDTTKYV